MTKQDKKYLAKIGPVKFYGGYQSDVSKKYIYPPERLATFLNINANKLSEVREFCKKYVFLPPKLYSLGLKEAFKEEQQKLLQVYRNYKDTGKINNTDLATINTYLELSKPKILEASTLGMKNFNTDLGGETNLIENNNKYLVKVFDSNSVTTLWEDFVSQVLNRQSLCECVNCGRFFLPESFHKRKFCCLECADAHRQRVKRAKLT